MKVLFLHAFTILAVASQSLADHCYYCTDTVPGNIFPTYPTYDCGKKCGYKYYSTEDNFKCWKSTHKMNKCFKDCCKASDTRADSIECGIFSWC